MEVRGGSPDLSPGSPPLQEEAVRNPSWKPRTSVRGGSASALPIGPPLRSCASALVDCHQDPVLSPHLLSVGCSPGLQSGEGALQRSRQVLRSDHALQRWWTVIKIPSCRLIYFLWGVAPDFSPGRALQRSRQVLRSDHALQRWWTVIKIRVRAKGSTENWEFVRGARLLQALEKLGFWGRPGMPRRSEHYPRHKHHPINVGFRSP
jgi:hypothetical protein